MVRPAWSRCRTLTTSCRRLVNRSKAYRPAPSVAAMLRRSSRSRVVHQASRSAALVVGGRDALVVDPLFGHLAEPPSNQLTSAKPRSGAPRLVAGTTKENSLSAATTSTPCQDCVPVERNINSPSSNAKSASRR